MWPKIGLIGVLTVGGFLTVYGLVGLNYEMSKPPVEYKEFDIQYVYHDHFIVGYTVTNNQTKEKWLAIKYSGVIPLTQVEGGKE